MKALIITDLHSWTNEEYQITKELTGYDICFLLGDISIEYLKQLQAIIHAPIYGLNGNHDSNNIEKAGITNIHGKCIEVNGITFLGMQGSIRYKRGPYNTYTQEESIEISRTLEKADVLLTHAAAFDTQSTNIAHVGLKGILEYIEENQPRLHIHGHLHINRNKMIRNTNSISVYKAAVIDLETEEIEILYKD